jgi:uncharacterized protein with PQ loop repeat
MANFIGAIASALSIFVFLPQTVRAYRVSVEGVSALTYQVMASALIFWLAYDSHRHYWTALLGVSSMLVCATLILARILQVERDWKRTTPVYVTGVLSAGLLLNAGAFTAIGWIATALTALIALPQLRDVFVDSNIQGVSVSSWSLNSVTASLWLIFGILKVDAIIISANLASLLECLAITLETLRRRRIEAIPELQTHNSDIEEIEAIT